MCGIAGILRLGERGAPPEADALQRMIDIVEHRGPDEQGIYRDDQLGLGHARLSIIDLAGGRQPVHNEDRSIWVVLNGEIFNYLELREELIGRGHKFYSNSDTEVLVHLYEDHGERFVEQLNGQFSIALWDRPRRRLVLARDRVGIRPLYYAEAQGRLVFASEIKSLLTLPALERRLDPEALTQLFTYWAPVPPRTVFAGISALPPGHLMVVDEAGERRVRRYWDLSFPERAEDHDPRPLGALAEELRALMIDAVRLRLRSDVPVGAYLSGGLDSAVITALVKHYTNAPLRTFSLTFEDAEFDERRYQQQLVEHLDTDHSEICCSTAAICEAFPKTIWHAESPVLRTAPTPLQLLSSLVRERSYKVVLTGEGADEVFGGYDIFREAQLRRLWAADPDGEGGEQARALLGRLYPYLEASPMKSAAYAKRFFGQGLDHLDRPYFGHIPRWSTTARSHRFFVGELAETAASFDRYQVISELLPPAVSRWQPLCRDQYLEINTLMSGYLLSSQGDRVMMANSVEGRFPFLDHRVIEWAARLPVAAKIHGTEEKVLLKQAMADLLPAAITRRPKQPYRAPDSRSFFAKDGSPAADYVGELLGADRIKRAGYFDPVATEKLVNKCAQGRAIGFADNMAFIGILSTMLLDEQLVRGARWPDGAGAG